MASVVSRSAEPREAIVVRDQPVPAIVLSNTPKTPSLLSRLTPPPPIPIPKSKEKIKREFVHVNSCVISKTHRLVIGSLGRGYCITGHDPLTNWSFCMVLKHAIPGVVIAEVLKYLSQIENSSLEKDIWKRMRIRVIGGWEADLMPKKLGLAILLALMAHAKCPSLINLSFFHKKQLGEYSTDSIDYQTVSSALQKSIFFGGELHPTDGQFKFLVVQ